MVTKKILPLTFLFLLLYTGHLHGQGHSAASVLAVESARFEAMIHRDTLSLGMLLSDDLAYIHSNALKETKAGHIHAIAAGKIVYKTMDRETATVRFYGKTSVTSGALHVTGLVSGNPFDVRMLYTAVYRKKGRTWKLVNWQSTRIP